MVYSRLTALKSPGNRGWSLLLAREAGETLDGTIDLLALLDDVRERYEGEYFRLDQRFNARLNLALAHIQEGRAGQARKFLEQAGELLDEPPAEYRSWWLDIEVSSSANRKPSRPLTIYNVMI